MNVRQYYRAKKNLVITYPWIFTINTANISNGSSASNQFKLPLISGNAFDFTIDWGDSSSDVITSFDQPETTHTYSSAGIYTVTINGKLGRWAFSNGGDRLKFTSVISWGDVGFDNLQNSFYGCENLTNPPGKLICSGNDFSRTFRDCTLITNLQDDFFDACPNAITFLETFRNCRLTSIPLGLFDNNTNVISFMATFYDNRIVSGGIPAGLFDNCPNVANFSSCFLFGNTLGIIPANLFDNNTLVTNFSNTFRSSGVTSVPADLFKFNTLNTNWTNCFLGNTLNTTSYSNMLISLDTYNASGATFHGGNSKYNVSGQTARNSLTGTKSWTITDGGLE